MKLRYIPHNEIDKMKWDACIKASFNGLIWGFSWYLDIVCSNWDAIVDGDYQKVMPLPYITKYKQLHVVVPPYVKQLGVFSIDKISTSIVDSFIQVIPDKFKQVSLPLNDMNKSNSTNFKKTQIKNYQLDLIQSYNALFEGYSKETKQKIEHANTHNLFIRRNISTVEFVNFYKTAANRSGVKITRANEAVLVPLINTLTKFNLAEAHGIFTQTGELCGVAFFLIYLNRLSIMKIAVDKVGASFNADYMVVNEFIRSNAGKNVTLDFPQNAKDYWLDFIQGFGTIQTLTSLLYRNNLPLFYKLMD